MAWGKGTMNRLYFSACLCNFIINVNELSFCCLHEYLAIAGPFPTCSPCNTSISVQLSVAKLHLHGEAFPDALGYLAILYIQFMPLILHSPHCVLITTARVP